MFRHWLNHLKRRLAPAGRHARRADTVATRHRLRFEPLEGRDVPSTSPIVVSTTADSGAGSLRAAITSADSTPNSTIVFSSSVVGTISLQKALPAITASTTITGPGADLLTISGNGKYQVFFIGSSDETIAPTVKISGLTIASGYATFGGGLMNWGDLKVVNCTFAGNAADYGGAIYTRQTTSYVGGKLTVTQDLFSGNKAGRPGDIGDGGAITNWWSGQVVVDSSAFVGNSGHFGGAIANEWGSVSATNSTFTANTAGGYSGSLGGAIINDPYYYGGNNLSLTDCTLVGNSATSAGGGIAGGDGSSGEGENITLTNTIVAGNSAGTSGTSSPDIYNNSGTISATYTLIGKDNGSGVSGGTGDLLGTVRSPLDPKLTPLGYYGGPTETMALLAGSPALGAGLTTGAPGTDQRGFYRTVVGKIDLGAFETQPLTAPPLSPPQPLEYQVNTGGDTAAGDTGTGTLTLRDAINLSDALAPTGGAPISFAIPVTDPSFSPLVTAASWAAGVATFTTANPNGFVAGQTVTVSGINPAGYNGTFTIASVTSATTFTVALASNPGTFVTGTGTASTGIAMIRAAAALPTVSSAIILDATSEAAILGQTYSTPLIDLNGASAGAVDGLDITASNSTVTGLIINNFTGNYNAGIYLYAGASNDTIKGDWLGVNNAGTGPAANDFGVYLDSGASNNTIGGTTAAGRNVLSGNNDLGVWISGSTTTGNVVEGNYIGTNAAGTGAVGNGYWGVELIDAPGNTVGGTAAGAGNVISGNGQGGVAVYGSNATGDTVAGNVIGLNAAQTAALGNAFSGIYVGSGTGFGWTSGTVSGTATNATIAGNVVAGNGEDGLWIDGNSTGNVIQGNSLGYSSTGAAFADGTFDLEIGSGASATTSGTLTVGTAADAGTWTSSGTVNVASLEIENGGSVSVTGGTVNVTSLQIDGGGTLNVPTGGTVIYTSYNLATGSTLNVTGGTFKKHA